MLSDQLEATIVWTGEGDLLPGRRYLVRLGTQVVGATLAPPKYRIDADSHEHLVAAPTRCLTCLLPAIQTNADARAFSVRAGGVVVIRGTDRCHRDAPVPPGY